MILVASPRHRYPADRSPFTFFQECTPTQTYSTFLFIHAVMLQAAAHKPVYRLAAAKPPSQLFQHCIPVHQALSHETTHRTSLVASGTTRTSGWAGSRVQAQKEADRSVEAQAPRPTTLLNHCRSRSTKDTMAMGVRKMEQTRLVMSSKRGSAGVSKMLHASRQLCRRSSLWGLGGSM